MRSAIKVLVIIVLLINTINLYAHKNYEIFLRPAEKTIVEFNKQISSIETVTGSNLIITINNYKSKSVERGLLKLVANELFSSANFHVIFLDGEVYTFVAYSDPTAKLYYFFDTTKKSNAILNSTMNTNIKHYYYEYRIPKEASVLIDGLNNLEKAKRVHFKYKKPLPEGVYGIITRYLDLGTKIFYELELVNYTEYDILLNANMLSDYLTESCTIVGMDSDANYLLKNHSKNIAYIVETVK